MNFYSAILEKLIDGKPTDYKNNQVIIIANDYYEAQEKLSKCIKQLCSTYTLCDETHIETYRIYKDLHECDGIMIANGFEGSTYHYGISKYSDLD